MFGRARLLCTAVLAASLTPACNRSAPPAAPKIALVADAGGFADRSFNAAARAGILECARRGKVEVTQVAPHGAADYETQLALLATQNYDAVIAVGGTYARDVQKVARRFEGTRFALIGGVVDEPNVASVTFKEQDGSFLAGALAALVTRTRSVAFLGGTDIARLQAAQAGYVAGVRQIDPRVRVRTRFAGTFESERAGKAAARALYGAGSDVIYVVAGKAGLGALAAAREPGAGFAIGADADQDAIAPGRVLASVVKRVDRAALRVCLETMAQKPVSGHVELGFADSGLELTDSQYARATIGAVNLRRLQRLRRAIETGALRPPATSAQLASFRPVPLE